MSSAVRNRKFPANLEECAKPETASFLARFNSPELLRRRTAALAQTNASHTKESDDALESILIEFEKLSF